MEHGHDRKLFEKISKVYSGHYHTRSHAGNIFYIGNPYEIYWNDYDDQRGFILFDTETLEHEHVDNPYTIFETIYYEDLNYQVFNFSKYEDKIVKVIVRKNTDKKKFEKFIDGLYSANVADLKIVENYNFDGWYSEQSIDELESENTLSILNTYIKESEHNLDKNLLSEIIKEIYQESCEMI
jgi:hypothetical protein